MRLSRILVICIAIAAPFADRSAAADASSEAEAILDASGVAGGLVVHLGFGDGSLTAELGEAETRLAEGLHRDGAKIEQARRAVHQEDRYGPITFRRLSADRLPYVDHSVNLLVVEDALGIDRREFQRVLAPLGAVVTRGAGGWVKETKPWPAELDHWTHFLHGPDNNAVARDRVVGPPRHLQWLADPIHLRSHEHLNSLSALVSARGRIFYIIDEGPVSAVSQPSQWRLVARDAFNGKLLWKRDLGPWEGHFRLFRSGPPDIARRLVASESAVFVTPGYGKPVAALDAATGRTLRVYEPTEGALEILHDQGRIYVLFGEIDQRAFREASESYYPSPAPRNKGIAALDAQTGQLLWKVTDDSTREILPATMAVSAGRLFYQNPTHVVCRAAGSGAESWRTDRPVHTTRLSWSTPTLVASGDVVLSADGSTGGIPEDVRRGEDSVQWIMSDQDIRKHPEGDVIAFDAATGRRLWTGEALQGFCAPGDVFVIGDRVWSGAKVSPSHQTLDVALNLRTGQVESRAEQLSPVGGHTRCYRNKATERFLVLGGIGVEFVDLANWAWTSDRWVRGTCQYGVMPCNGLLYVPPDSCACRPSVRLHGFAAMAPARRSASDQEEPGDRLLSEGGLEIAAETALSARDWPTYRHDAARSGCTDAVVPAQLQPKWETPLGGRLTAPTVAGGRLLVAQVNAHAVHSLDSETGETAWSYLAGGRIDSPPTVCRGRVVFGCRDGWVYCLRLSDGALLWKFRAAPAERFLVAQEQVESVWPVHGSVLIQGDLVWFAAGRSSYLDQGLRLCAVRLDSGEPVVDRPLDGRDPNGWITAGTGPDSRVRDEMPGTRPDILSAQGDLVLMGWTAFDKQGRPATDLLPHLFSATGFLDDTWWHRTYWQYGSWMRGGFGGWPQAARQNTAGRLLAIGDRTIFGFGRQEYDVGNPQATHAGHVGVIKDTYQDSGRVDYSQNPYRLFAAARPESRASGGRQSAGVEYLWQRQVAILARAMVLAGENLWIAGPEAKSKNQGLAEIALVRPGRLLAVSPADGEVLAEYRLNASPVLDGLAAVPGRIYLTCLDGTVRCFEEKSD